MTQCEMIIDYMRQHDNKITTYEAFKFLYVTRLAARIFDLRQLGYKFVTYQHKTGKGRPYVIYELVEEK